MKYKHGAEMETYGDHAVGANFTTSLERSLAKNSVVAKQQAEVINF